MEADGFVEAGAGEGGWVDADANGAREHGRSFGGSDKLDHGAVGELVVFDLFDEVSKVPGSLAFRYVPRIVVIIIVRLLGRCLLR